VGTTVNDPIIEVREYSLQIGPKEILSNISFRVDEGEYLSIIGPNGSGKTTLLKCLDGIMTGGTGSITIKGRPLHDYGQRELAKLMGYVPQADARSSPFTVFEFVMMGRYPYLSPFSSVSRSDECAVREALALTGTMEFSQRSLDTLSGGERQKVYIAAALAQGAGIFLLDEPTTFLDPKHTVEIQKILKRLNHYSGATILSVTHDINHALLTGGKILALKEGMVVFCGNIGDIVRNGILESIYEKSFLFAHHPQTGASIVMPDVVEP
jgi:iron complex transport system ATP-binding protein